MTWLLTGLLGGWLAADATALGQILISQPIVGGALAGLLWGDLDLGLRIGGLLQLFALSRPPLGGRTPEDFATAGVVGPSVAVALTPLSPYVTMPLLTVLGTAAGLATALGGKYLIRWNRAQNERLVRWVDDELARGRAGSLDRAHALGVVVSFSIGFAYTVCAATVALAAAVWLTNFDTPALARASQVAEPILWGMGAGITTRTFVPRRGPMPALFLGFLVVLLALGRTRLP